MQKTQAAATLVAAAFSACVFPFCVPRLAFDRHTILFVLRRVGLGTAATVAPSFAQHFGVPGTVGGSVRLDVASWSVALVQCDRDTAPTDIDTKALVLLFVSCFGQPLATGTNCLGL